MRAAFFSLLGYFLTVPGIVCMGILDASMVFFLPLGIDFVVILMTARKPEWFWLYALLATVGSLIGAAGTFWALAHRYGTQIVRWMKTPTFQAVVGLFIALAVIGTIVSAVMLIRGSRRRSDAVAKGGRDPAVGLE